MSSTSPRGNSVRLDSDHSLQQLLGRAVTRINSTFQVEVRDQLIQLHGQADSWHEKQLAQESLRAISCSYRIQNRIQVPAWT